MDPIIVFGMTASAITALLVQVFKAVGLPIASAPWFTLACAIVSVGLGLVLQIFPDAQRYIEALVSVFAVFLLATGMYHGGKNVGMALGLTTGQKQE
jgi:hypothetical protein